MQDWRRIDAPTDGTRARLSSGGRFRIVLPGARAAWSVRRACAGNEVGLRVAPVWLAEGVEVELQVWERDAPPPGAPPETTEQDDLVAVVRGAVRAGALEATWRCEVVPDDDDPWVTRYEVPEDARVPEYYFVADLAGERVSSGLAEDDLLRVRARIEEAYRDGAGRPLADVAWEVLLPGGEVRRGRTDALGRVVVEDAPPGRYSVRLEQGPPPRPVRRLCS